MDTQLDPVLDGVAIVGLSGRFPGAATPAQFWYNLKHGVQSISHFSVDELDVPDAAARAHDSNYVRARSVLDGIDQFDPEFFGIYPQEAELLDPQHRVFLECCWEAIEDAGYDVSRLEQSAAVFAGCSPNSYFLTEVCQDRAYALEFAASYQVGQYTAMLGAIADTLATRVAYKLNLRGPAVTVLSACSTSLVAICQACSSLLTYQCDSALAGGVSITLPQKRGYLYQPGGMVSPDGHCRSFDENASGTVFGSGAGVVFLKRLADAVADRDHIYGVIRGFATNNDGASKVGFTAPSVEGQANVIAAAQAMAGVSPDSISYIEAHGTGTPLGDPIEVAALTQAFRSSTERTGFCALGTAKPFVGHLDVAAGVTGLIKTALSLEHREIPGLLHFERPNPKLNLESSPFYINRESVPWVSSDGPRRAGVSAFGVGGTNAHLVVEESPVTEPATPNARGAYLLPVSGRSEKAAQQAAERLANALEAQPETSLADVAFTLQTGRRLFPFRATVAVSTHEEAVAALRKAAQTTVRTAEEEPTLCLIFPGQGAQYPGMGAELYRTELVFRDAFDTCAELARPHLGCDMRDVLFHSAGTDPADSASPLHQTRFAQPALFSVEYALAQLWMSWGLQPASMIGHSVGEFVAATLAGVFSLADALLLVTRRGLLMQTAEPGAMLAVRLPESALLPLLDIDLCVAAVNAPSLTVISGPTTRIAELEARLAEQGAGCRRLRTSHAFHSAMMDPILDEFGTVVAQVKLSPPQIPYISTVTGDWITAGQATDAQYWTRHLRLPVRFSDAAARALGEGYSAFLEAGPGQALQTLVRQQPAFSAARHVAVSSLPDAKSGAETLPILRALGALWCAGVTPDCTALYRGEKRSRVPLPTYPFQRQRFWVDTVAPVSVSHALSAPETVPAQATDLQPNGRESLMKDAPITTPAQPSAANRKTRIQEALLEILADLSGMAPEVLDPVASFLDLGFDSLFLTQVAQGIQGRFALQVTFRQLLTELPSIGEVAAYLDRQLPDSAFAVPEPAVIPAVSAGPLSPASASIPSSVVASNQGVEGLLKEQLHVMHQLMQEQMNLLRQGAANPVTAPAALLPIASPVPNPVPAAPASTPPAKNEKPEFKAFGPYKPIQRTSAEITAQQRQGIDALIATYTTRTPGSKAYTEKYRCVLADPRVVSGFRAEWKELIYPLVVEKSRGSRLWDVDGNEYIDVLNGFGPIALGHLPDMVREAAQAQLEKGIEIGPQTPLAGEVASLLSEVTGCERVTFCNTGSEAVMAAMRLARTVTGRKTIIFFAGDYHGNFDEVLAKNVGSADAPRSVPIAPGIPAESVQNVKILEFGTPTALEYIRAHANEIAGVLVEPVQSRHPNLQPADFLRELRRLTADSGAALILDEIVTGFRIHLGGAQAFYNIHADLATYGKVLGGGFPIGAIGGNRRFMDALDGGAWSYGDSSFPEVGVTFFAGTFVRHPLALAAAKAVLTYMKAEGPGLQTALGERATRFVGQLQQHFDAYSLPVRIENCGSIFYFSFPPAVRFGTLFYYYLRCNGVHIQEGFPCFLTTAHTDADLAHVADAFAKSLALMAASRLLPDQGGQRPTKTNTSLLVPAPKEAPVTQSQLEILVSAKLSEVANCSFNEAFTVELSGPLHSSALTRALSRLLERHDILRATFDLEHQSIHFTARPNVPVISLDFSNEPDPRLALTNLISEDAATPFDLENGPLTRIRIVRLAQDCHILVFTSHHIVCDGWSTNILLEELSQLYTSEVRGTSLDLPEALSFAVYAQGEADRLTGADSAAVEKYWTGQFTDIPSPLDLPTDRPRPSVKSFAGATVRRTLGIEATQTIRRAGASQGSTLFVTLLAGFHALMSRLSGQSDIVVGIPSAAQSLLDGQTLAGHCVNLLPIRAQMPANVSFAELLRSGQKTLFDAYEHQQYTFGTLVRKLGVLRDPSRLPLVEVQFNLERMGAKLGFDSLRAEVDSCPKRFVNFDLFLNIVESPEGLALDLDYNTDLFDRETVLAWLSYYEQLLFAAAANLSSPIASLPLLTAEQTAELVFDRNRTEQTYPSDVTVQLLFNRVAEQFPQHTAVISRGVSLSYAELNQRADRLASVLRRTGAGPGSLVALFLERSADLVTSLLAVLKTGAAYLPLDPSYPKARLDLILDEAKPVVILTEEALAPTLTVPYSRILCLDAEAQVLAKSESPLAHHAGSPNDLAYVIYTSGSTGKPKGVQVGHRALINFLWSMRREPGLESTDRLLAVTTISFDIAGLELLLPLLTGATVIIASRQDTFDGQRLRTLIEQERISVLQATPSTWVLLLEAGWEPSSSLKMLCGGEALPASLSSKLTLNQGELWNMYGPTETTIWSAVSRVLPGAPVRIGPPIANTQFYVLNESGQLQPSGVPGELYIAGDSVAHGYFERPELNRQRFLPDPFRLGNRMYRTGDLVRQLATGELEFFGRLDDQVKIRGFRIELGDIEAALTTCEGIKDAAVVVREDRGSKQLAAFCVADTDAPDILALRSQLSTTLPAYMVPNLFSFIERLPRTPNGKLDRRSLSRIPIEAAAIQEQKVRRAATNTQEELLVAICREVLGVQQIGIDDDLFAIGADSIQVFRIVARASRQGLPVAAADVLTHRSIERILANRADTSLVSVGAGPEPVRKGPGTIARVARQSVRVDRQKLNTN